MSQARRVLFIGLGATLIGVAVWEDLSRRMTERRYAAAEASRQQLERAQDALRAIYQRTADLLAAERQQTQALTQTVTEQGVQLHEAVARLAEEDRIIRELEARLASTAHQLDQVQGELSLALQRDPTHQAGLHRAIQLDRVFISTGPGPSGLRGRVVLVDETWRFVVVNLGWDTVKIGDTISIFRQDELLAKARVERVQEGVAAAALLPDWHDAKVQINDVVRIL